jgi:TPR repeat protein
MRVGPILSSALALALLLSVGCGASTPKPKPLPPRSYADWNDCADALNDCVRACRDRNDAKSCHSLAFAYLNTSDYARAIGLFEGFCKRGNSSACGFLGHVLANKRFEGSDVLRGRKLLFEACRKGSPAACNNYVYHWSKQPKSKRTPRLERRLLRILVKACRRGNRVACSNAALRYRKGRPGIRRNLVLAALYNNRACARGYQLACRRRARWVERELYRRYRWALRGSKKTYKRCKGGDRKACVRFGVAVMVARWIRRNKGLKLPNILRLSTSTYTILTISGACEGGDALACMFMADVYRRGAYRLRADPARAAQLLWKACQVPGKAGNAACIHLGKLRLVGESQRASVDHAVKAFDVACRRGRGFACGYAGYAALHRKKRWTERGIAYLRDGCRKRDGYSCSYLGLLHERGRYVRADREKAQALFRRACDLGYRAACRRVEPRWKKMP